jgi:hypothetical protein
MAEATTNATPQVTVKNVYNLSAIPKVGDVKTFVAWKLTFTVWLKSNELLSIVETPPQNYTPQDEKKSADALLGIMQTVEVHLLPIVNASKNAAEAWKVLHSMFEGKNDSHIADLKAKLINIQIQPQEKVAVYYGRIMALKTELGTLGDKSLTDADIYSAFLRGVKGRREFKITYSTLKNAKLSIHEALVMLIEAENDFKDEEEEPAALVAKSSALYCKYCKDYVGHDISHCPKVAAKEAKKKKQQQRREREEALVGKASGSGMSGLYVTRSPQPGAVPWEEVEPL